MRGLLFLFTGIPRQEFIMSPDRKMASLQEGGNSDVLLIDVQNKVQVFPFVFSFAAVDNQVANRNIAIICQVKATHHVKRIDKLKLIKETFVTFSVLFHRAFSR